MLSGLVIAFIVLPLVRLGASACVFGPGDIRVAHRTGEFVPVAELTRATGILAAAVERFAKP